MVNNYLFINSLNHVTYSVLAISICPACRIIGGMDVICCWAFTQIEINSRSIYRKQGLMSNRPQRDFFGYVIFCTVNNLRTLVSDAKFAPLPCHFKSGAHHDFAKKCWRLNC